MTVVKLKVNQFLNKHPGKYNIPKLDISFKLTKEIRRPGTNSDK